LLYFIVRGLGGMLLRLFYGHKVIGAENVPKDGRVILAANHICWIDPLFVTRVTRRYLNFMGKAELFENPIFAAFLRSVRSFPVKRGQVDRDAYRKTMDILKAEEPLVIFPEGTRNTSGNMLPLQSGAARFSLQTDTPIVPVAIIGSEYVFKKWFFSKKTFSVVGEPIHIKRERSGPVKPEEVENLNLLITSRINELIEKYKMESDVL